MIISQSEFLPYQLPLIRPWASHHGTVNRRSGWLIKLQTKHHQGVGDCAPLADAGTETAAEARKWLEQHVPLFNGQEVEKLLASLDDLSPPPAARCGVETALIDLLAKQSRLTMARWLNSDASSKVQVNTNLGRLDETTIQRLPVTYDNSADGYSVIKLKMGMAPIEQELAWLQQLSGVLPKGVSLRLDANQAWSFEQAEKFLTAVASLPIESIEEPLDNPKFEQLHRLQQATNIPLALDESLSQFKPIGVGVKLNLQQLPLKRITIKPMVLGGLLPSLKLAQQAFDAGIDVIVTTTVDSAVGVWAATALAAALGRKGEAFAHGLATSQWLADDVAEPPLIKKGTITLNHK